MRHYQKLDSVTHDTSNDTLLVSCTKPKDCLTSLWFGREGLYVSVSSHYGPLEIALRPRLQDLVLALSQLKATDRLTVLRMIGTGQAHLELGLSKAGELLIRTTIVADATGHFAMNMILASHVTTELYKWLGIDKVPTA